VSTCKACYGLHLSSVLSVGAVYPISHTTEGTSSFR